MYNNLYNLFWAEVRVGDDFEDLSSECWDLTEQWHMCRAIVIISSNSLYLEIIMCQVMW